jgi:hypothetical protein
VKTLTRAVEFVYYLLVLLVKTPTRAEDGNLFGGNCLVGENTNKGCGRELVWWY